MRKGPLFSQFDYVLMMLANRLEPRDTEKVPPGRTEGAEAKGDKARRPVVFLLGAGCSRQYGLPNFQELLSHIWEDCFVDRPDSSWSLEVLRDQLDKYWQAQGPEARLEILGKHLRQVSETTCPGYIRLAKLALQQRVKAIVNMNFDTLLEDALEEVASKEKDLSFTVSTTFQASSERLIVYKPHGTIGHSKAKGALEELIRAAKDLDRSLNEHHLGAEKILESAKECFRRAEEDRFWVSEEVLQTATELITAGEQMVAALRPENECEKDDRREILQKAYRRLEILSRNPTWGRNDLILDIANSDLFADPEEQRHAHELLTQNDVVTIGYSGVDAKIAAALRSFLHGKDPRDRKLFFVNLSPPDPRLLLVMAERASQDLLVTREDGTFENFMEHLERAVEMRRNGNSREKKSRSTTEDSLPPIANTLMTRAERQALASCRQLALSIRAALNVADRSTVGIEEHARRVYDMCLELASAAGNSLTSPEKYITYCAALLHDLGYFQAYSRSGGVTGMALLKTHGELTRKLVAPRLEDPKDEVARGVFPASYDKEDRKLFQGMLLDLCNDHGRYKVADSWADRENIRVEGIDVPIRYPLIQILFSTAEHLVREHPFMPSTDPVVTEDVASWVVEDPILDLYLRRREDEVEFVIDRQKVTARLTPKYRGKDPGAKATWLLSMARAFVSRLHEISCLHQGWGIRFDCSVQFKYPGVSKEEEGFAEFQDLVKEALEEKLAENLEGLHQATARETASLLRKAGTMLSDIVTGLGVPDSGGKTDDDQIISQDDLLLVLERVKRWVETVEKEIRTSWLADMGKDIRMADLLLQELAPPEVKGELALARDAVNRSLKYYEDNEPGVASHSHLSALKAARRVLLWVMRLYKSQQPDDSRDLCSRIDQVIEALLRFEENMDKPALGEISATLDVVAIYTCRYFKEEPRVGFDRRPVKQALERIKRAGREPHQGLLHLYFPIRCSLPEGASHPDPLSLEGSFLESFEKVLYPAWRFFARNWHDNSESLLMARACFDLGSSSFRPEVAGGLKRILTDKVDWDKYEIDHLVFGHDECTLCSSRLLYTLAYARRLFPREELDKLGEAREGKTFDKAVGGLLRFMLKRDPNDPAWWGLGCEENRELGTRSADYLAWAARAVAFCLEVDEEIYERSGERWLCDKCEVPRDKVELLLSQRWADLFKVNADDLKTPRAEEPRTFTLGRVALAYLDLLRMGDTVRRVALGDGVGAATFRNTMIDQLEGDSFALMSRVFLLPLVLLKDGSLPDGEAKARSAKELVELFRECHQSRIWITKGSDAGSWGFNVKNTQTIVTSLMAFWRHVFENRDRFEKAFAEHRPTNGKEASAPARPFAAMANEAPVAGSLALLAEEPSPVPPPAGKRTRGRKSGNGSGGAIPGPAA